MFLKTKKASTVCTKNSFVKAILKNKPHCRRRRGLEEGKKMKLVSFVSKRRFELVVETI